MYKSTLILIVLTTLISCQQNTDSADAETTSSFKEIPTPVKEGGEPNLFVAKNGQVFLSWVEYLNDSTDALQLSRLENGQWMNPVEIARGIDWFVNWADFPSIVSFTGESENMAAHWLQKSAHGTYDYDVRIAQSKDGGRSWAPSFIPHTDGVAAEHGFVSLLPLQSGNVFAVWLDGRNTKGEEGHEETHSHGGGGAMTLRTAEFDADGNLSQEAELDSRVCDCCQTDVALTSAGPIVVYRDRSEEEIRDISIVRKVNGKWTNPQKVFNDNWKITGCPVNGPAVAAQGQSVAIAWFTAAEDKNIVKVVLSKDAGQTFTAPFQIDDGKPVGRVDVVFADAETALVSWMENTEEGGEIRLAKVSINGKIGESITATKTGVSRRSGFPILEKVNENFLLAWTHVDSVTTIKTMFLTL